MPTPVYPHALATELAQWPLLFVFLDYDGTLAELALVPEAAVTLPGVLPAVKQLASAPGTQVAVVSGRPLSQLARRFSSTDVWLAGEHGAAVYRAGGGEIRLVSPPVLAPLLTQLAGRVELLVAGRTGWRLERKSAGLALHFRQAAAGEVRTLLPRVRQLWASLTEAAGLEILPGNKVLELRPVGADKGRACRWLLDQAPGFRPVFLGDDVTDEDGFATALQSKGTAVLVSPVDRPSRAKLRLNGPQEVVQFLACLGALRVRPASEDA